MLKLDIKQKLEFQMPLHFHTQHGLSQHEQGTQLEPSTNPTALRRRQPQARICRHAAAHLLFRLGPRDVTVCSREAYVPATH